MNQLINTIKGTCHFSQAPFPVIQSQYLLLAGTWRQRKNSMGIKKYIKSILLRVYEIVVLKIEVTFLVTVVTPV